MKYALIGCGRIAPNHIKAAVENGLEIAALCDLDEQKCAALAEKYSLMNVRFYTDYKKMLAEISPDVAAVATDSGHHAAVALDCLDTVKALMIEKPVAMSLSDADKIIAKAAEKRATVSVCMQNRFNAPVQQMRAAIDSGALGRVYSGALVLRWKRGRDYYDSAAWRGRFESDGGTLMNQCIHGLDLLRWMLGGKIESVCGMTANLDHPYIEAEDTGLALVRFGSGALATVESTTNAPEDVEETLTVIGENGMIRVGGSCTNKLDLYALKDKSRPVTVPTSASSAGGRDDTASAGVYGHGHTSLYADVLDALAAGREPYVTLNDGRDALEFVLAIYKSQKTGRAVSLPLPSFSAAEMSAADIFRYEK